ncbi:MAG: ribosome small subunit-dependent GTPase A, partial [Eubacteriales bacterium]|nr:ribosome small subunit-dependent GTPase A [Eubacteriales bacterium]
EILICINKIDLTDEEGLQIYREIYDPIYPMIFVSGKTEQGIPLLKKYLRGRVSALAGPSGVGKSTLLNKMESRDLATVGEIGQKSQRGKHTTRHVELFDMEGGGMLFDTPGFTSFDVMDAKEGELAFLYPEMVPYIGECRYDNCRHLSEPDCRIRAAVEDGKIHKSRYGSYMDQIYEIQTMRRY